jgi:hypothetical protein
MAHLVGGFGQRAVVKGENSQLKTIGNPDLNEDTSQIVLDALLLGVKLGRDILVLVALANERDDLHFFWRKTAVGVCAGALGRVQGRDLFFKN